MKNNALQCERVTKSLGPVRAVKDFGLQVRQGEILALVGPSGCGKTTLLRLLAGFESPDAGTICLQNRVIAGDAVFVPPERRGIGMVFQDYALFPHLTVEQNVAFGLNRGSRSWRHGYTGELLKMVGLAGYGKRYPHELSGGERQRVALARALAPQPVVVLLDEPFSSLDADRRARMREEVKGILRGADTTVVFVTHDQEEALFFGDRLAVLKHGSLEQVDTPEAIFGCPATRFVAEFMGHTDFLPGQVVRGGILTELGVISQFAAQPNGACVEVAVRADDIQIAPRANGSAAVVGKNYQGVLNVYEVRLQSGLVLHSIQPHTLEIPVGARVQVAVEPGHALACFPAA
jgi:iron(III) transport system ATP-binding protein